MNYKQKLAYMVLGAAILALGIVIGQFLTPEIEAQNNDLFDEVRCSKLTVVDEQGRDAIVLSRITDDDRGMIIYNSAGKQGFSVGVSDIGTGLIAYDSQERSLFRLFAIKGVCTLGLFFDNGENAVHLGALETAGAGRLSVANRKTEAQIQLGSGELFGTYIKIDDNAGNTKWSAP